MKKEKVFRVNAKKLFLTYPQCDISLDQVQIQLEEKLNKYIIKDYLIVNEDHEDKSINIGKHVHVFIKLEKKADIKKSDYLDIVNSENKTYHGNYQGCKNEYSTLRYLLKDVIDINQITVSKNLKLRIDKFGFLMSYEQAMIKLAEEGRVKEAMDLLKIENPNAFLRSCSHYKKSLTEIFLSSKGIERKFDLSKFIIPDYLKDSLEKPFKYPNKTLFVRGEPGTGKTELIKTFLTEVKGLQPLIINNFDSLSFFERSKHSAIVFDDCSFEDLKREELIMTLECENETTIKVRYKNIVIPAGIPRFIIHNKYLHEIINKNIDFQDEAISRRVNQIEIYGKLFQTEEIMPVEK